MGLRRWRVARKLIIRAPACGHRMTAAEAWATPPRIKRLRRSRSTNPCQRSPRFWPTSALRCSSRSRAWRRSRLSPALTIRRIYIPSPSSSDFSARCRRAVVFATRPRTHKEDSMRPRILTIFGLASSLTTLVC